MSRRMIRRLRSTKGSPVTDVSICSRETISKVRSNFFFSSSCHRSTRLPGAMMRQRSKSLRMISQFKTRRLYTAWDNIGDEQRFFAGVDTLEAAGIPPTCLLVYMLIGFDRRETWERVLYRFRKMTARGIRPFPMVFGDRKRGLPLGDANHRLAPRTLGEFQRWAIRRLYSVVPFEDYSASA